MKMTKKKVVIVAVAICLVAIISMGTLAWFNAEDAVNNDFKVMDSLTDFEVDVWEYVTAPEVGVERNPVGKGDAEENGHEYTDAAPNAVFVKEVYVENTSNNDLAGQYIKMEVTFTNYAAVRAMFVDLTDTTTFVDCTDMLEDVHFSANEDDDDMAWWYDEDNTIYNEEDDTATYVFYLKRVLENEESECLFETVRIPATMDINDADYLAEEGFQINVVAYAIQSANIKDPNGTTDLQHAVYAFGEPWANRDTAPGAPVFPTRTGA